MGKDKLRRFAEVKTFGNVFEPDIDSALRGSDVAGTWNTERFLKSQPITLELGCGKGEYTVGQAQRYADRNFLGVDIKGARLWRGAKTAHETGLDNVQFLRTRIDFITSFFGPDEVDEIWITFPDPQPNKNRRKKRLTHPLFLDRYRRFLKEGGTINLKTDDRPFYDYALAVAELNGLEVLHSITDIYNGGLDDLDTTLQDLLNIKTYYEQKWLKIDRKINFLSYRLTPGDLIDTPDSDEL